MPVILSDPPFSLSEIFSGEGDDCTILLQGVVLQDFRLEAPDNGTECAV